jgi:hypothetical protein
LLPSATAKLLIISAKNITVIAEVISFDYFLRQYCYDASNKFTAKLEKILIEPGADGVGLLFSPTHSPAKSRLNAYL